MKTLRSPTVPVATKVATRRTSQNESSDTVVSRDDETQDVGLGKDRRGDRDSVAADDNSKGDSDTLSGASIILDGIASAGCAGPEDQASRGKGKVQKLDGNAYKPFGSRSRASSVGSDASISSFCKGGPGKPCGEPVRHSERGVACDKCEHWFHASCQGILKPAFEALAKYKVLAWLCPDCKQSLKGHSTSPKGHNNLTLETKVEQLATLVDTHMRQVEQSLKEQEHAVHEQTKLIERSIRDGHTQKASYAEMVKGTCSDIVSKVSAKVSTIPQAFAAQSASKDLQNISQVFDDFLEKDKRKNNLVVHNLPEAEGSSLSERSERDTKSFQEVVRDTFRMNVSVSKVYRVGKVMQNKPRLLIITLDTPGVKGEILRMAPQLRDSVKWGNIYITPDLTKTEREAARKLREELATRKAAGETDLTIRKGRIVTKNLAAVQQSHTPRVHRQGQSHHTSQPTETHHQEAEATTARSSDQPTEGRPTTEHSGVPRHTSQPTEPVRQRAEAASSRPIDQPTAGRPAMVPPPAGPKA